MEILLIGGKGFLGSHILNCLDVKGSDEYDVTIGSRHPLKEGRFILIDLDNISDHSKLRRFDYIINCADIRLSGYEELIDFCLSNGVKFLETSADPWTTSLLLELRDSRLKKPVPREPKGLFIFGVGIFPGISNLLFKRHLEKWPSADKIELAIQYNIFSGAGKGMCKLMVKTIDSPCHWFEEGQERQSGVASPGMEMFAFDDHLSPSLQITLSELFFMHSFSKRQTIKTYLSFKPAFLNRLCYHFFKGIPRLGIFKGPVLRTLYGSIYLTRAILFKNRKTDIRLLCMTGAGQRSAIWFNDAFRAAGLFTRSIISTLNDSKGFNGCYAVGDLFDLEPSIDKMKGIDFTLI